MSVQFLTRLYILFCLMQKFKYVNNKYIHSISCPRHKNSPLGASVPTYVSLDGILNPFIRQLSS